MSIQQREEVNELIATMKREKAQLLAHQAERNKAWETQEAESQEIINSLNTRIAEYEKYQKMPRIQQFFYRLFKNPAWL